MLWVCTGLLEEEKEKALCFLMAMWVYESGCCLSIKPFYFLFFFNETPSFVLKLKGVVTGIYTKRNLPINIVVRRRPRAVPI